MEAWLTLQSPYLILDQADIDTDQIIPARFLKQTHKEGLGRALFYDWRYDEEGRARPQQPLNARQHEGLRILLAGPNFGCGSSREHAVWALYDYGFRAVLSPSMGDIFRSNALKNGLLPLEIPRDLYAVLLAQSQDASLHIDLGAQLLTLRGDPAVRWNFVIDSFSRTCLMEGLDQLDYLLRHESAIQRYEEEFCP